MMLIDELSEKFGIKNLRLDSAKFFSKKNLLQVFLITDETIENDVRTKIEIEIEKRTQMKTELKIKRNVIDADAITHAALYFFRKSHGSIADLVSFSNVKVEIDGSVQINLILPKVALELFSASNMQDGLKNFVDHHFFCSSIVKTAQKNEDGFDVDPIAMLQIALERRERSKRQIPYFALSNVSKYIGDNSSIKTAQLISSAKPGSASINLCGEIDFVTKRSFNKKTKDGIVQKEYVTFLLRDSRGGKINCTYFGSKGGVVKLERLAKNTKISALGFVDVYKDNVSFKPAAISLISDYIYVEPAPVFKAVREYFELIKPQKYSEFVQESMFDSIRNTLISNKLSGKNYVVFDLETTGLNPAADRIIEIGAVRIENGNIKETFQTLVNPMCSISEDATRVNGIDNRMVERAPLIEDVIGDFYKFCYGADLVAYNSDFDMSFLNLCATQNSYYFDNKVIDALTMARKSNAGTSNHKLGTMLEHFKIRNEAAHRALGDAVATAKLFIELAEFA